MGSCLTDPAAYRANAIIIAALTGEVSSIEFLLEKGADINSCDDFGDIINFQPYASVAL